MVLTRVFWNRDEVSKRKNKKKAPSLVDKYVPLPKSAEAVPASNSLQGMPEARSMILEVTDPSYKVRLEAAAAPTYKMVPPPLTTNTEAASQAPSGKSLPQAEALPLPTTTWRPGAAPLPTAQFGVGEPPPTAQFGAPSMPTSKSVGASLPTSQWISVGVDPPVSTWPLGAAVPTLPWLGR